MKLRTDTIRRWNWLLVVIMALILYHGAGTVMRQETERTQIVFPVPGEWTTRKTVRKMRVGGNKVRSWRSQESVMDWQNEENAWGT